MAHKYAVGDKVVLTQGGGKFPLCGFKNGETYEVVGELKRNHTSSYEYETYTIESETSIGYARPEFLEPANAKPTKGERIKALEKANADMLNEVEALKKRIETLESADKTTYTVNLGPTTFTTTDKVEASEIAAKLSEQLKPNTNQRRKALINEAKADLDEILNTNYPEGSTPKIKSHSDTVWMTNKDGSSVTDKVEFIANSEKGVVVALIKTIENELVHKGVAKVSEGDVFNETIGKNIAFRKAIGLEVPRKFTHATQPEIAVGHVVIGVKESTTAYYRKDRKFTLLKPKEGGFTYVESREYGGTDTDWIMPCDIGRILDDTEAQYE